MNYDMVIEITPRVKFPLHYLLGLVWVLMCVADYLKVQKHVVVIVLIL